MLLLLSLRGLLLLLKPLLLLLILLLLLRAMTEFLGVLLELDGVPFHRREERSGREVVRVVHRHVDAARETRCCASWREISERRNEMERDQTYEAAWRR